MRISRHISSKLCRQRKLCVLLLVAICLLLLQTQKMNNKSKVISIVVVLTTSTNEMQYQRALDTLKCYSKIHGYKFILAHDEDYKDVCKHGDVMYRRHCVVAQFLNSTDYLLFLDADMGVVNPRRRIEEFIDDRFDVTLYDRFMNAEIAAGSYLLKNSPVALDFVNGFSAYNTFVGSDNGALHAHVISKIFPDRQEDYKICLDIYNASKNIDGILVFENCIRSIMGISEVFGKYRILRKLSGWARDGWLTNSLWNPETDFMIHAWKTASLRKYKEKELPISVHNSQRGWFDPIVGNFDFDKCIPGNYSWNFDPNLIAPVSTLRSHLADYKLHVQRENYRTLTHITKFFK